MTTIVSESAANTALNTYQINNVSLHNDNPSTTGANEIDSADYARQPFTFSAASGGRRYGVADATFNLKSGDSVLWVSYWFDSTFVVAKSLTAAIDITQDSLAVLKAATTYLD